MFGPLVHGDATGVSRSRELARATYAAAPFRLVAGNRHPDHGAIAAFREAVLAEAQSLFVPAVLPAKEVGGLTVGTISVDGSTARADAAKSEAVSSQRLGEPDARWRAGVVASFALAAPADQGAVPGGLVVADAIARRQERLARLAEAEAALEARASGREGTEQAASQAEGREREARARRAGRPPRGRPPAPPPPGRAPRTSTTSPAPARASCRTAPTTASTGTTTRGPPASMTGA